MSETTIWIHLAINAVCAPANAAFAIHHYRGRNFLFACIGVIGTVGGIVGFTSAILLLLGAP